jgi:hypothetical protein
LAWPSPASSPPRPSRTAFAIGASANPNPKHGNGFVVFQQNGDDVKKVYDDGNLDGRGCVIGKEAVFDKATGDLKVVPKVKCNFPN